MPLVASPEKVVRPGDVLIVVAQKRADEPKTAWSIMLGNEPHGMVVAEKEGVLGHLNSPGAPTRFVAGFNISSSFVILRPPFQERFGDIATFEKKMNRYLLALDKVGFEYDSFMQTDLLSPGYARDLQVKIETDCLKKGDVKPLYCTELTAMPAALLGFPYPEGQSLESLFDEAVAFVKSQSTPESFVKDLQKTADEILDMYLADIERQLEGFRFDLSKLEKSKRPTAAAQSKIDTLKAQHALIESMRPSIHQILKDKAEGKTIAPGAKKMLQSRVIRPRDYLAQATKQGYQAIGFYADSIPSDCYATPRLAGQDLENKHH